MVEVVPATLDHAKEVARRLRRNDAEEVWVMNRLSPEAATRLSIGMSGGMSYAALIKGRPVAVFGAALSILGRETAPWLLGTDEIADHASALMHITRKFTGYLLGPAGFKRLRNTVYAENAPALKYLARAGFTLSAPFEYPNGAKVREFSMEKASV